MKIIRDLRLSGVALALLLSACGGQVDQGSSINQESDPVSVADRVKFIDLVAYKYKTLLAAKDPKPFDSLAKWMVASRKFKDVQANPVFGCVTASFTDGRSFAFSDNNIGLERASVAVPVREEAQMLPDRALAIVYGQLTDPVASELPAHVARIKPLFTAKKWNFAGPYSLDVDTFGAVKAGFLVINCHSALRDGNMTLLTDSDVTDARDAKYSTYLNSGLHHPNGGMGYVISFKRWLRGKRAVYGIGPKFVSDRLKLYPHSMVVMHYCFSGAPEFAAMRNVFFSKGADVLLGWDQQSSNGVYDQLAEIYDYMLGSNKVNSADPDYRPFELSALWTYLKGKGKTTDPNGSKMDLIFNPRAGQYHPSQLAALNPIIRKGQIRLADEGGQDVIMMEGIFGSKTPTVEVDGTPVEVISNEPTKIEAKVPNSGAGSFGPVVVKVGNSTSNPYFLTRWTGTGAASIERKDSSLKLITNLQLRFRGFVNPGLRRNPDTAPGPQDEGQVVLMRDSTGSWSASGQASDSEGVKTKWSGSGTFSVVDYPQYKTSVNSLSQLYGIDQPQIRPTRQTLITVYGMAGMTVWERSKGTKLTPTPFAIPSYSTLDASDKIGKFRIQLNPGFMEVSDLAPEKAPSQGMQR